MRAPEGMVTPAMVAVVRQVQTPGNSRLKCLMESFMPPERSQIRAWYAESSFTFFLQ